MGLVVDVLHELLFGAVGTQNVALICNETFADKRAATHGTNEALVMPVAILKRNESGASNTSNRLGAGGATFGKEFSKAIGAIRFLIT